VIGRATLTIDTVRLPPPATAAAPETGSAAFSVSVADEYDIVTGGLDVIEQQVYSASYP